MSVRVRLSISHISIFFLCGKPRLDVFARLAAEGYQVIDYGICLNPFIMGPDGYDSESYECFMVFATETEAVQFKLTYLC
jgi:hypothetical protein